jgi:hypothetical protein
VERDAGREARARQDAEWNRQVAQFRLRSQVNAWLSISAVGGGIALLLSLFAWRRRHVQRGFGLAFASLLIFGVDLVMLGTRSTYVQFGTWLGP